MAAGTEPRIEVDWRDSESTERALMAFLFSPLMPEPGVRREGSLQGGGSGEPALDRLRRGGSA